MARWQDHFTTQPMDQKRPSETDPVILTAHPLGEPPIGSVSDGRFTYRGREAGCAMPKPGTR